MPTPAVLSSRLAAWWRWRPAMHTETLLALAAAWWALLGNRAFLDGALHGRDAGDPGAWLFGAGLVCALFALHWLLLLALAVGRATRPLLALLIVASELASFFMLHYGIYVDPSMLRNLLHTHPQEARELLGPALAAHLLLYGGPPLLLLGRVRLRSRRWPQALAARSLSALLALALLLGCVLAAFQPLASLMRNQRELRYRITPAALLWSAARAAGGDVHALAAPRQAIGTDASRTPVAAGSGSAVKPLWVVLVVGETARAANWGLSGYARQTTPQLAALPVLNFTRVSSCGTDTETSLPCLFAPVGRRRYDEARIRGSQSLLHVLARAGVDVEWRDNQSGCKGVCDGLPSVTAAELGPPGLCRDGRCLDEALLHGLPKALERAQGVRLLVLHPLGNHGPAYFRRYPSAYARWGPACASDDLHRCTREQIVAAYDNALLYTDHQLATLVRLLQQHEDRVDSALVYVSDHGESLGEHNLYLHGLPYAIAPDVQTQVPMVMWLSRGLLAAQGLDPACLARRAGEPAAHDHLFHTLLGLFEVRTALYEPAWDLAQGCRSPLVQASAR